jgi:hypothetical protein
MKYILSIIFVLVFSFAADGQTNSSCTYTINGQQLSFEYGITYPASGAPFVFKVETQDGCRWAFPEFYTLPGWISDGNVLPNTTGERRSYTGVFRGYGRQGDSQSYRVEIRLSQPSGCVFTPSATIDNLDAAGGNRTFTISANGGCEWHAVSQNDWITVNLGANWSGSGTIGYTVTANTTSAARTGTITAGGQTFTDRSF